MVIQPEKASVNLQLVHRAEVKGGSCSRPAGFAVQPYAVLVYGVILELRADLNLL